MIEPLEHSGIWSPAASGRDLVPSRGPSSPTERKKRSVASLTVEGGPLLDGDDPSGQGDEGATLKR